MERALVPDSAVSVVLTGVWAVACQAVAVAGAAAPIFRLLPWPEVLLPLLLAPLALGLVGGGLTWPGHLWLRLSALWCYGSAALTIGLLFAFAGAIDQPGCGPSDDCEHGLAVDWMLFSTAGAFGLALGLLVYPSLRGLGRLRRRR